MANVVEILLVVRDLATNKLDSASRKMDADFRAITKSATGASVALNQMAKDTDKLGESSRRTSTEVDRTTRDLVKIEQALHRIGGVSDEERIKLEAAAGALRNHRNQMRLMEGETGRVTSAVARFVTTLFSAIQAHRGYSRSLGDNDRDSRRLAGGLNTVERALAAVVTVGGLLPRVLSSIGRGFAGFIDGMGASEQEAAQMTGTMERMGSSFSQFLNGLPLVNTGLASFGAIVIGITTLIPLLSGVVLALTGAVTGLAASLSTLGATIVALPAALGALGGIMAAVLTIIKPATDGILGAVQAAGKAQAAAGAAGGGSKGGGVIGDPVKAAEQGLSSQRRIDALQVTRLENELKQARLDAVFRVRQAERDLASARIQAFTRLIDLERQLADLRERNDQNRAQLEQELAAAQAQQAADQARGGQHAGLTGALVGEAKADLTQFNKDAATSEGDLQQQIQQQRLDSIKQIKDAEDNLVQARIDGIAHVRDLENSLAQTRLQNAQQEAAAQRAITQAQAGAGGATPQVDAYRQALQALDPVQRHIVGQILALKDRWGDLTKVFRDRFLLEVSRDLDAVNAHLPLLARLVGGFADVITRTLGRVRALMNDPQFLGAFTRAMEDATANTDLFSDALVKVFDAIVQTVDAAKPLLDFISKTADAWATWADNAARAGNESGELTKFFERVRHRLKLVLDILGNIIGAFVNIGKIAAPFGDQLLRKIDKITQGLQDMTGSKQGKNSLRDFFRDALPAASAVAGFVTAIVKGLAGLGRQFIQTKATGVSTTTGTGNRADHRGGVEQTGPSGRTESTLTQIANTLTAAVKPLADAIGNIAQASGPSLAKLVADIVVMLDAFSQHTDGLKAAIGFLDALVRFMTFVVDHGGPFGDALGSILTPFFVALALAPGLTVKSIKGIFKAFDKLNDLGGAKGTKGGLVGRAMRGAITAVQDGVKLMGDALAPLRTRAHRVAAQLGEALQFKVADFKARAHLAGEAIKDFGGKVATAATNMKDLIVKMATEGASAAKRMATWIFATAIPAMIAFIGQLTIATAAAIGLDIALDANIVGLIVLGILALIAVLIILVKHWDTVKRVVLAVLGKLGDEAKRVFNAIVGFVKDHWEQILTILLGPLGVLYLLLKVTGIWDKLKDLTGKAWDAIKDAVVKGFHAIVSFFTNTAPGLLKRAFSFVWDAVSGVTERALGGIEHRIQDFVNSLIGAANWVLHHIGIGTTIPEWGGDDKQVTPSKLANVHKAASGWIGPEAVGSIVKSQPGGLLHIVEAGHDEAVVSLDPKHRDRTFAIIGEVLRRLGFRDPRHHMFEAIATARAAAADLLPDASILSLAAGAVVGNPVLVKSVEALREAARIDKMDLPYVWGGGHQSSPAPADGPFDCSGFVSHILQHIRELGPTEVSGALASYGSPGLSNAIGILANDGHVYMEILGRYFGTSTGNPGGGPGLLPYGVRSGFALRHPTDMPSFKGGPDLGSIGDAIMGGVGAVASIGGKIFTSVADVVHWISDHLPHFPKLPGLFGQVPGAVFDFVRGKSIDFLKDKVPFFGDGGEVSGAAPGAAMPVVAHVGEWILNNRQLGRLATAMGGIENVREIAFQGTVPMHSRSFAAGGIVHATGASPFGGPQKVINQTIGPIHTTSAKIDIDYIARIGEQRLLQGA